MTRPPIFISTNSKIGLGFGTLLQHLEEMKEIQKNRGDPPAATNRPHPNLGET
jgi:hypothetical protein